MDRSRPTAWAHYLPASAELRETGLTCRGVGEQSGQLAPLGPRVLSPHALVLISAGSGSFHDGTRSHPVRAPAWIWLAPGVPHAYAPDAVGWTEHWVLFEGAGARTYRSHGLHGTGHVLGEGSLEKAEREEIFVGLHRVGRTPGRRAQLVAASLVHRLLGALLDGVEEEDSSVLRTLAATATEDLSVARRAALCGLSPRRLREEVRRSTGLTPHEVVLATRLARAQELLARSELSVGQIGREVGIDDPSYFSRLFLRRVGLSPREFRRQQQRRDGG
ncbi:AraC family transcriptional regulator [Brachybacterium sp. YJGR34]|uniref:AraC family transcriptional regulator n=1 Tax=Brachybacterium sp. YJGR34 TaxID=2059911 RepID=UPI000E0AB1D0|nr:AraC family transcriptional regulator [Brachybacterium sp. YJGR34]